MCATWDRVGVMTLSATHSIAPRRLAVRHVTSTRRARGKGTTFTHDGRGRLTKAVKSDGTTMAYVYNSANLRIESVKNPSNALRAVGCSPPLGTAPLCVLTMLWSEGNIVPRNGGPFARLSPCQN
jgi:YD repeat-containing protein